MPVGSVKFFNHTKGFGFIERDDGQPDTFVHVSAVNKSNLRELKEGDRLEYEIATERGKQVASNLKRVD